MNSALTAPGMRVTLAAAVEALLSEDRFPPVEEMCQLEQNIIREGLGRWNDPCSRAGRVLSIIQGMGWQANVKGPSRRNWHNLKEQLRIALAVYEGKESAPAQFICEVEGCNISVGSDSAFCDTHRAKIRDITERAEKVSASEPTSVLELLERWCDSKP